LIAAMPSQHRHRPSPCVAATQVLAICLATLWGSLGRAQEVAPTQSPTPATTRADPDEAKPALPPVGKPQPGPKDVKAPKDAGPLQRVEVIGSSSDNEQRRASTASKIVIGREEIERFGDSSVSEVLKRLPGVTSGGRPGRGGDVRMRGMGGGYTQILVNGERMPPGFSLNELPPDQVERIEVMRAPTAEFGTQAVAGTINIVLKEALKKTLNEVRVGLASEVGHQSPNVAWTRNDKVGDPLAYTLTLSAYHNDRPDSDDVRTLWSDAQTGAVLLEQHETGVSQNLRDGMHLNGRVQLTLGAGESLTLMPFMVWSQGTNHTQHQLEQSPGGIIEAPFSQFVSDGSSRFGMLRANAQWQKRVNDATRLDLRGGIGQSSYESESLRQEYLYSVLPSRTVSDQTSSRETSWNLTGKLSHQLVSEHSLVAGLELDSSQRLQSRTTVQDGLPILSEFGDAFNARSQRMAAYAQDEWNVSPQIAAYAGLRWEGIDTTSDASSYQASNRSSVVTPLLHATWKPDEKSRDQWRSSLTRSYKAATLSDLIARPSLSQRFPSGANEISSPDRAGNPNLLPELATGFELAYEHYFTKGGLMSANYFYRRISDLMRNVVALEDVSWSNQQRWVSRPQNVGKAVTQGIELEAKFRLDELLDDALPVAVHNNLSFFDSTVEQVAGPNNRLEGQPTGTANVGADYRLRSVPISLGASVNFTPGYATQLSALQSVSVGAKVVTDAFLVWFLNPSAQLRLSASNLLPRDYANTSSLVSGTQRQQTDTANVSNVSWGLRLELKL
jgi:iron complex outermembrane receptor protein